MKHPLALALLLAAFAAHADDTAERDRIRTERAAVEASFAAEQKACRARFAVTDCIHEAQRTRNAALADLRRQERVLNDAERQRRAAERHKELEERNSPEKRQQAAERRRLAVQEQKDREARAADKAQKRAEDEAKRAAQPPRQPKAPSGPPGPQGTPRAAHEPASHGPTAEEAAKNRAAYEQRIKEAEEHNAKVRARQATRKKPAASDLPLPPQ